MTETFCVFINFESLYNNNDEVYVLHHLKKSLGINENMLLRPAFHVKRWQACYLVTVSSLCSRVPKAFFLQGG